MKHFFVFYLFSLFPGCSGPTISAVVLEGGGGERRDVVVTPRGHSAMSGDSFTVMTWGSSNGIKQAEGGGAVKHPTIHRTAPITKTQLAPNANSAKAEKHSTIDSTSLKMPITTSGGHSHGDTCRSLDLCSL